MMMQDEGGCGSGVEPASCYGVVVYNMANDGVVICILHESVSVSGSAVIGVQCDWDGAEQTALQTVLGTNVAEV